MSLFNGRENRELKQTVNQLIEVANKRQDDFKLATSTAGLSFAVHLGFLGMTEEQEAVMKIVASLTNVEPEH